MAIRSVDREEFNRIFTFDRELVPYIGEELEWYANDAKNVIGVVARRFSDSCWNYAILRRSVLGDFVVATLSRDFMDLQTARVACRQEMAAPWQQAQERLAIRTSGRTTSQVAESHWRRDQAAGTGDEDEAGNGKKKRRTRRP